MWQRRFNDRPSETLAPYESMSGRDLNTLKQSCFQLGGGNTGAGLGLCEARDELTDSQNNRLKVWAHGTVFMPAGFHELRVLFIAPLKPRRSKALDDLCDDVTKTRQ
jgi:hypothetical protein